MLGFKAFIIGKLIHSQVIYNKYYKRLNRNELKSDILNYCFFMCIEIDNGYLYENTNKFAIGTPTIQQRYKVKLNI